MKAITLSVTALMLLGTLTAGMADEISVDQQITAIQEAPAQERVQLMNQFKERLATMNADEREAAIAQLRTQTQTQTQARLQDGTAEGEHLQTRTETQTRERLNEGEANSEAAMTKTRTITQERSRVNEMQQTQQQQMQQQQQQQQMQQKMQQVGQEIGNTIPAPSGLGQ